MARFTQIEINQWTLRSGREAELSADETETLADLTEGGVFGGDSTKIFVMTPAIFDKDLTENTPGSEQFASQRQGNNPPLYGPGERVNRLDPLEEELSQILPDAPIEKFVYRRQTNEGRLANGAFGANMVNNCLYHCYLIEH